MTTINNGGPALPFNWEKKGKFWAMGMSMRDYFAAKAMQAVITDWLNTGDIFQDAEIAEVIARDCYIVADAMLKARND